MHWISNLKVGDTIYCQPDRRSAYTMRVIKIGRKYVHIQQYSEQPQMLIEQNGRAIVIGNSSLCVYESFESYQALCRMQRKIDNVRERIKSAPLSEEQLDAILCVLENP